MWLHRDKVAGRRRLAMGLAALVVTGCATAGTEPETAEPPSPTASAAEDPAAGS